MQALLDTIASAHMPTDAQRLFHGRGGRFPGSEAWTLDAYPPVWLITRFGEATPAEQAALTEALRARQLQTTPDQPLNAVLQTRHEGRSETSVLSGSVPESHVVTEAGARYRINLLRGQNHGLFLDMAEGRRWVREHAPGQKVLNLFAYTGAFSVVALLAGARQVVNVDMSSGAMAMAQQNHALNGVQAGARFLVHDIFKTWGKISRSGPYHLVVVDPPSYQLGSFVATKDYLRLMRRLPDLLRPGGRVLLCLNAPELGTDFLRDQMREAAPELVFEERLDNPAVFADVSDERSLKVLVYRAPELTLAPGASTHQP